MTRPVPRPRPIDVLASLLLGPDDPVPPLCPAEEIGPRAALERAVLPALERPPCVVSFSGGRDSSAVLAVAVATARRLGLPDPVAAIMRFPGAPETDETAWQQMVLDHLKLGRVEVLELADELDALGPLAAGVLREHGLIWPANAYMHLPLLDVARGGSLLTGIGGDELFGTRGARHVLVLRRAERPTLRDVRALAAAAQPRRLRAARWRRGAPTFDWLTPHGRAVLQRALADEEASWPARWDASLRHWRGSRAFGAALGAVALVGGGHGVLVLNPFIQDPVLAEFANDGGATGYAGRTAAMRRLFGDLLPDALLARESKATFSQPLWGPATREFAARWSGGGVEHDVVDVSALRSQWLSPQPDARTLLLLHQAWLAEAA